MHKYTCNTPADTVDANGCGKRAICMAPRPNPLGKDKRLSWIVALEFNFTDALNLNLVPYLHLRSYTGNRFNVGRRVGEQPAALYITANERKPSRMKTAGCSHTRNVSRVRASSQNVTLPGRVLLVRSAR